MFRGATGGGMRATQSEAAHSPVGVAFRLPQKASPKTTDWMNAGRKAAGGHCHEKVEEIQAG